MQRTTSFDRVRSSRPFFRYNGSSPETQSSMSEGKTNEQTREKIKGNKAGRVAQTAQDDDHSETERCDTAGIQEIPRGDQPWRTPKLTRILGGTHAHTAFPFLYFSPRGREMMAPLPT